MIGVIQREVKAALRKLGLRIELVTDLAINADGRGDATGLADDDVPVELSSFYGLKSYPPDGAAGVVLKLGGLSLLICYRHPQYEPTIQKSEVALFSSAGALQLLDKLGNMILTPAAGKQVNVGGTTAAQPAVLGTSLEARLAALEAAHNAHTHVVTGSANLTTGVVTGATAPTTATVVSPGQNVRSNSVTVTP